MIALREGTRHFYARAFPGRFRLAGILLVAFLATSAVTRLALAAFNGDWSVFAPSRLAAILSIGTIYDLAAGAW